jgi:hypothetical protein
MNFKPMIPVMEKFHHGGHEEHSETVTFWPLDEVLDFTSMGHRAWT